MVLKSILCPWTSIETDAFQLTQKHGWNIRVVTIATEELHGACPNVQVKIGNVEIVEHFVVQDSA